MWYDTLQATFVRVLINQRKRYSADLRDVLTRTYTLRHTAAYTQQLVSELQAARSLRQARALLTAIQREEGGQS